MKKETTGRKCFSCGATLKEGAKFCPKCGKPTQITQELISAATAGDTAAQNELYYRTFETVYSRIRAKVSDEDTAMDILQDTYLKAFQNLPKLENAAAFPGWILSISRNATSDWYRTYGKDKDVAHLEELEYEGEDTLSDENSLFQQEEQGADYLPEEAMDRKETARLLGEILDTLPESQRIVLMMYFYEERTLPEIAEELGVPLSTVKSRFLSGQKKVEQKVLDLERQGTKLYSLAPIPFLLALLRRMEGQITVIPIEKLLGSAASAASGAAGTAAAKTAGTAAAKAAAGGSAKAAAGGAGKTATGLLSKSLATKIIAAVAALVVLGGGTAVVLGAAGVLGSHASGEAAETLVLSDYTGQNYREADAALTALGVQTVCEGVYSDQWEEDTVVRTDPEAGTELSEDTQVTICYSLGPEITAVSQEIVLPIVSYEKTIGDEAFSLGASSVDNLGNAGGPLSYTSSNDSVVTVDSEGVVSITGTGTATITVTAAAVGNVPEVSAIVTVTADDGLVQIPNFIGMTLDEALDAAETSGVDLFAYEIYADFADSSPEVGTIYSMRDDQGSVAAGSYVEPGTKIYCVIYGGEPPTYYPISWTLPRDNNLHYVSVYITGYTYVNGQRYDFTDYPLYELKEEEGSPTPLTFIERYHDTPLLSAAVYIDGVLTNSYTFDPVE